MKKLIIAALTAVALAFTVPQIVRSDGFNTVSDLTSVSSDICVANASGGCLQNEAASTTNPTLIPDQGELTTGIGGIGSSTVSIIVNGVEQGTFNNQGITGSVGGARLRAQAPSATAPNILPSGASDPNTGIGWDGADRLSLIAGGVEGLLVSTTGVTIDTSTIDTLVIATRSTITATGIVDLSSSDASTTTEGFILPQHATACAGGTAEGQVCWEADANILHIGDGTTIQDFPPASAFSGDATVTGTGVVTISTGWVMIGTQVAANDASLTQTGLDSTYDTYAIVLADLVPVSDAVAAYLRVGDSGGVDSAASDYAWGRSSMSLNSTSGAEAYNEDDADAQISITGASDSVGNAAGEGIGGMFFLHRPGDGTTQPAISGTHLLLNSTTIPIGGINLGARLAVITLDRIQFLFSSGNISTGRMTVYGLSHT